MKGVFGLLEAAPAAPTGTTCMHIPPGNEQNHWLQTARHHMREDFQWHRLLNKPCQADAMHASRAEYDTVSSSFTWSRLHKHHLGAYRVQRPCI